MSTILPKIRTKYGENIGIQIFVSPPDIDDNKHTFLSSDTVAGVASFSVDNGLKFANAEYVVIGQFGGEKSEIIRIGGGVTATTIGLATASLFAHNRGERITYIPYDYIRLYKSGAYYVEFPIRADSTETMYQDTSGSISYLYSARFYNTTNFDTSQACDQIYGSGFADNSAGLIIREALVGAGEKIDSVITKEFLYSALNEGRHELDQHPNISRWSFRTAFNYIAGEVVPGTYRIALPADIRNDDTAESILSVRIGKDLYPLAKADKTALNRWYSGVAHSLLDQSIAFGSTSIVLESSGDFDESGTVAISAANAGQSIDYAAYTSNDESSATLGGVTGIADSKSASVDVWQGASFGAPTEYTVYDGYIVFSQPFEDDMDGENIYLDYYTEITDVNSDGDILDEADPSIYIPYLRYRIKARRDKNLKRDDDDDYKSWAEKREGAAAKEYLGQDIRIEIDVPC
jgi:hypothetical protein